MKEQKKIYYANINFIKSKDNYININKVDFKAKQVLEIKRDTTQ